jgi:hypothetical protein
LQVIVAMGSGIIAGCSFTQTKKIMLAQIR